MRAQIYSRYVYQMLMEHGNVSIPDMGTFSLKKQSATFDTQLKILHPPKSQVVFTNQTDETCLLLDLLRNAGMSQDNANKILSAMLEDYKLSLSQVVPFELDGFGTLINQIFIPKEDHYFNLFHGLKPVKAIPVPSNKIVHNETYVNHLNHSLQSNIKRSTKHNFIFPISLAIIVAGIILAWLFTYETQPKVKSHPSIHAIHDTFAEPFVDDTPVFKTPDTSQNVEEKSEISHKMEEGTPQEPSFQECIVIVGAFKSPKNVKKMKKRIESKGYDPYVQSHNGLVRIGVRYKCKEEKDEFFIEKMKSQFNKSAWYLSDTL